MRNIIGALALALLPVLAFAADTPDWAYPVTPQARAARQSRSQAGAGQQQTYTQAQIDDAFNPPDWFPDEHPPMPPIVAHGRSPRCAPARSAICRAEMAIRNPRASPVCRCAYLMRQMAAFKNGDRKGVRATTMIDIAQAISDADVLAASEYFASLKPGIWTKVIETDTVPKSYVGAGGMRFAAPGGEQRADRQPHHRAAAGRDAREERDPHSGFIDYVPVGSIAKGEALVTTGGGGKTIPCAICHGQNFKGLGDCAGDRGPPAHLYRAPAQRHEEPARAPASAMALMKAVVERLTLDDMIAIAAYLGSREP